MRSEKKPTPISKPVAANRFEPLHFAAVLAPKEIPAKGPPRKKSFVILSKGEQEMCLTEGFRRGGGASYGKRPSPLNGGLAWSGASKSRFRLSPCKRNKVLRLRLDTTLLEKKVLRSPSLWMTELERETFAEVSNGRPNLGSPLQGFANRKTYS